MIWVWNSPRILIKCLNPYNKSINLSVSFNYSKFTFSYTEILTSHFSFQSGRFFSWLCCGPCLWLKSSTAVHRMALTAATLVVTSLLVASPIIFLISAAPHSHPRDCMAKDDDDCLGTPAPPPECQDQLCRLAAASIQSRINWKMEPCKDFKSFSCSSSLQQNSLRVVKSAQEIADYQMQRKYSELAFYAIRIRTLFKFVR